MIHIQKIDLTGERLGLLRVIEQVKQPEEVIGYRKTSWWRCRCACGREVVKPRSYLINAARPHCGCLKDVIHREAGRLSAEARRSRMGKKAVDQLEKERQMHIAKYTRRRVCPECGKAFETFDNEWGWKYDGLYFCRWSCLRAYERKAVEKKKRSSGTVR